MSHYEITSPDDLPEPADLDYPARRADLENDALPRLTSAYQHRPISRAQLEAEIARLTVPALTRKQA